MEFRLLGPVDVLEGGRALPVGGRRQRAVLAHLVLARGSPVPTSLLIEQVWGDAAPAAVRTSLHTYVSRLRAALGPDRVETRSTGYALHAADAEVDAACFELLLARARALVAADPADAAVLYGRALALWHGPALGDLAHDAALQPAATRLEALRDAAVVERIDAELRVEQPVAVLPDLEEALHRHPLREDLWVRYVLALYRSDRQAEALAALERVRRLLREELGVPPGEQLRRLQARVLGQDPQLAPDPAGPHGYRLLDVLGTGPSAVVHRALQPHVEREVAVKVLRPRLASDQLLVERFAVAARAAARLEHPNVVPVHDVWAEPGSAGLVMRVMRGGSLAAAMARGAPPDAVAVLAQVAHGLAAGARHGLHRASVRPDDVLLDEDGNACLSASSHAVLTPARDDALAALAGLWPRGPVDDAVRSALRTSGTAADVPTVQRFVAQLRSAAPVDGRPGSVQPAARPG